MLIIFHDGRDRSILVEDGKQNRNRGGSSRMHPKESGSVAIIHGMRVACGRAMRRTNLRGVTTCLMHVRGSVASVRRSYFNEGIVVATPP